MWKFFVLKVVKNLFAMCGLTRWWLSHVGFLKFLYFFRKLKWQGNKTFMCEKQKISLSGIFNLFHFLWKCYFLGFSAWLLSFKQTCITNGNWPLDNQKNHWKGWKNSLHIIFSINWLSICLHFTAFRFTPK